MSNTPEIKLYNGPEALGGVYNKRCILTVFIHDYAFPPSSRIEVFPFIYMEGKPREPIPLQIFTHHTLELVRRLTDEELGKLVRLSLSKIDEEKNKIEKSSSK